MARDRDETSENPNKQRIAELLSEQDALNVRLAELEKQAEALTSQIAEMSSQVAALLAGAHTPPASETVEPLAPESQGATNIEAHGKDVIPMPAAVAETDGGKRLARYWRTHLSGSGFGVGALRARAHPIASHYTSSIRAQELVGNLSMTSAAADRLGFPSVAEHFRPQVLDVSDFDLKRLPAAERRFFNMSVSEQANMVRVAAHVAIDSANTLSARKFKRDSLDYDPSVENSSSFGFDLGLVDPSRKGQIVEARFIRTAYDSRMPALQAVFGREARYLKDPRTLPPVNITWKTREKDGHQAGTVVPLAQDILMAMSPDQRADLLAGAMYAEL